ncbi:MAG: SusC/RagA family TonB-linked outer membrane protein, partial [Paludibacteraceae bacterium]|nr:SusC/RagA family TonB-linked outer membrane protein [Paludibacteraceae bacterium]
TTASKLYINDMTVTDYWLERGDYVNIDYLTIGYNIPLKPQTRVSRLRVSASVNNLATISAYSGLTPIINSSVINSTLGVDDKNSYPVSRTYSVALLLQF